MPISSGTSAPSRTKRARDHHYTAGSCVVHSSEYSVSPHMCCCGSPSGSSSGDPGDTTRPRHGIERTIPDRRPRARGVSMDLAVWLNFISPDGPCFDPAVLPIPGSPVALSMIEALVDEHVKQHDEITVLEIG